MTDPLIPRRDLDFLLHDWLRIEHLTAQPRFAEAGRETVDAVLDLGEQLAVKYFLPHYKAADIAEPRLEADGVHVLPAIGTAMRHYAEAGLFSAGFAEELGGMSLPYVVCSAVFADFAAANVAAAAYPMLTVANARLIATFGSPAQIARFARPQIAGEWFGTMCLSEPQAGSALSEIRTSAVADGVDAWGARYRLTGNKMWISGGDQDISANIVHLVLAKVAGADGKLPAGTGGLSLFIVPKLLEGGARNDVTVAGLNHKMGYRGTANCLLNFGEGGGALGWLVGEPGQGLRQMFVMMNEARIGVGIGAAAVGYRGYRHALAYARERLQGRATGSRDGPPVAIIAHADVRRMLLQQKAYVEGALALCLYCAALSDAAQGEAELLLGLLTPVAKTWPSIYGLKANDIAIQIHGGYGYTRDFDVEQLYRDNRLNPIHEGTTGIQGIDLVGRKLLREGDAAMAVLGLRIAATSAAARGETILSPLASLLDNAWGQIVAAAARLRDIGGAAALDNATAFLDAFGHVVMAWLWLDQGLAAARLGAEDRDFAAGKLAACRYFYESELPLVTPWLMPVIAASTVHIAIADDQF